LYSFQAFVQSHPGVHVVLPEPSPAPRNRLARWLTSRNKAGSIVVVGALLAGVLVASFGVGYRATAPDLDNATGNAARGTTVVQINSETQRVEAEAHALAPGKQEIEVVTLADNRVATVNNTTKEVRLLDPALMNGTVTRPGASTPAGGDLSVVAGNDAGYVVEHGQDAVEQIGVEGAAPAPPVKVPGGLSKSAKEAVPDGGSGIWVLTGDEKAAHIVGGKVVRLVETPDPIKHLTVADGRPVAITASGATLDVAADPIRAVGAEKVPSSLAVVVGSPRGSGRYLVVVDRRDGKLVVTDPRTKRVQEFGELPTGAGHNLGAPVVLDDRVYVPDYPKHLIYVFDVAANVRLQDVEVPGKYEKFSLEVRQRRVWANDQFDQQTVVIGRDGRSEVIDKGKGPGVETNTTEPEKPPQTPSRTPSPSAPPPATTAAPPRPAAASAPPPAMVTVPAIPAGTRQDDACTRIKAANLRCDLEEIGAGGPTGTVRDTKPPGGSRVAEQSVVRVSVYGAISVPTVVGQHTGPACDRITGSRFTCDRQPMPGPAAGFTDLDVVAQQNPQAGQRADLGSAVTVRFWERVPMENLLGRDGAQECGRIVSESNQAVQCTVSPGAEAPTPAQNGTVSAQSVAAGADVRIGDRIVLTVFGNRIPRVPVIPPGTDIFTGCKMVQDSGYTCVPAADGLSPTAGVTSQDPPGGTPQNGGNVVVHHEPYASTPLWLWKHNAEPTYAIRFENVTSLPGYTRVGQLGRAYQPEQPQPGTGLVNGFFCLSNTRDCWGHDPNHYYSRAMAPPAGWVGWSAANPAANTFNLVNGNCPAGGQVPIYRFRVSNGGDHRYSIGPTAPAGTDFTEPLGCIWSP
jgi:hypothetical protein